MLLTRSREHSVDFWYEYEASQKTTQTCFSCSLSHAHMIRISLNPVPLVLEHATYIKPAAQFNCQNTPHCFTPEMSIHVWQCTQRAELPCMWHVTVATKKLFVCWKRGNIQSSDSPAIKMKQRKCVEQVWIIKQVFLCTHLKLMLGNGDSQHDTQHTHLWPAIGLPNIQTVRQTGFFLLHPIVLKLLCSKTARSYIIPPTQSIMLEVSSAGLKCPVPLCKV